MKERELQDAIVEEARLRGWLVYHTFDSRRSSPGFPDLVLVKRRMILAECKVGAGQRSLDQIEWGARLQALEEAARLMHVAASGQALAPPLVSYFEWRENDWLSGAVSRELAAS